MLAGRTEESLATAARALELAVISGANGPRVSALVTNATARASMGDYENVIDDLKEAGALALEHDPSEVARASMNLGSILLDLGDLRGATSATRDGLAHNERTGMVVATAWGNLCEARFLTGAWDEAEEIATAELERGRAVGGFYADPVFLFVLTEVALARSGDVDVAVAATRHQLELAFERVDDQTVLPALSAAAWTLARAGRPDEAGSFVDDLLERRRRNPGGVMPGYWMVYAALALVSIGRDGELAMLDERPGPRFLEAALAIDARQLDDAAAILHEIGAPQLEAEALVLAIGVQREAGEHGAADVLLSRSRALLQGLGATARLRELDALSPRSGGS